MANGPAWLDALIVCFEVLPPTSSPFSEDAAASLLSSSPNRKKSPALESLHNTATRSWTLRPMAWTTGRTCSLVLEAWAGK